MDNKKIEEAMSNVNKGWLNIDDLVTIQEIMKIEEWDIVELNKPTYLIRNLNIKVKAEYDYLTNEEFYMIRGFNSKEKIISILEKQHLMNIVNEESEKSGQSESRRKRL